MKKLFYIIAVIALGVTACNNKEIQNEEQAVVQEPAPAPVYNISIPASLRDDPDSKAAVFDADGVSITNGFSPDDKIYVYMLIGGEDLAVGYDIDEAWYLTLKPTDISNDGREANLSGALKFGYFDENYDYSNVVPEVGSRVYLLHQASERGIDIPCYRTYLDYADQYNPDPVQNFSAASAGALSYSIAEMLISEISGDADSGYDISLCQRADHSKTWAHFGNVGSMFRQRISYADGTVPGIKKLSVSLEGDKNILRYYPFKLASPEYPDLSNIYEYSDTFLEIDNPAITPEGDVYFAMMFNRENRRAAMTISVELDDDSVYTVTKNAPIGGFANGKYYHGSVQMPKPICLNDIGSSSYEASDGDLLLCNNGYDFNGHITVADGATVTFKGVRIHNPDNDIAVECLGDATLIFENGDEDEDQTNIIIQMGTQFAPAIYVPESHTLTIKGSGKLEVSASQAPAIGCGDNRRCGHIVIDGQLTLIAEGGVFSAGIGSGRKATCGEISIYGGNITAVSGNRGAGIGTGLEGTCGRIQIYGGTVSATGDGQSAGIGCGEAGHCSGVLLYDTVTSVSATKGNAAPYCIGAAKDRGYCSVVKIGCMTDDHGHLIPESGTDCAPGIDDPSGTYVYEP